MKISFQIVSVIISHYEASSTQIQEQGRRLENFECKPELRSRKQQFSVTQGWEVTNTVSVGTAYRSECKGKQRRTEK